jgi:hypothetical protein
MTVLQILKGKYSADIATNILDSYAGIERNYARGKWKVSELDAGHFVESVRRLIELELFRSYTPFTNPLPNFSDNEMKRYEGAAGDESFRLLIPRVLKAVYTLRNKRGVGHITGISPNRMDATFILHSVKWVLAELVRLSSGLSIAETQELCDQISERQIAILWKDGMTTRILTPDMKTRDQILVLLYDRSPQGQQGLQATIGYLNVTNFRKILKRLDKENLIAYELGKGWKISPTGTKEAERIIKAHTDGDLMGAN